MSTTATIVIPCSLIFKAVDSPKTKSRNQAQADLINKLREAEVLLSEGHTVGDVSRKIGVCNGSIFISDIFYSFATTFPTTRRLARSANARGISSKETWRLINGRMRPSV